jgi:hypothetical protein
MLSFCAVKRLKREGTERTKGTQGIFILFFGSFDAFGSFVFKSSRQQFGVMHRQVHQIDPWENPARPAIMRT